MNSSPSFDVFICHSSTDKDTIVIPIVQACKELGISCWFDADEIQWGDDIPVRIGEGLSQSRFVLVVISPESISRGWPIKEISVAIEDEVSSGMIKVLPLFVGDREDLISKLPVLRSKRGLQWNENPLEIALELKRRTGVSEEVVEPSVSVPKAGFMPKLNREFTDRDRDRFLTSGFGTICSVFENAGRALEQSEPRVSVDTQKPDNEKFRCVVYVDGNRKCQCQIWVDSSFGSGGIHYFSGNSLGQEFNARNESISVVESSGELRLKGMMSRFSGESIENATPTEAAEALWKRFSQQLEH